MKPMNLAFKSPPLAIDKHSGEDIDTEVDVGSFLGLGFFFPTLHKLRKTTKTSYTHEKIHIIDDNNDDVGYLGEASPVPAVTSPTKKKHRVGPPVCLGASTGISTATASGGAQEIERRAGLGGENEEAEGTGGINDEDFMGLFDDDAAGDADYGDIFMADFEM